MTLKIKNFILNFTCVIHISSLLVLLYVFFSNEEIYKSNGTILIINSFLVVVTTLFIYLFFKKSLPSEVIFFLIYLTSFSLQYLRVLDYVINFETYMITVLIGRMSIFFKYTGLLSLLGASLFSHSIKKQKIGNWTMISLLVSGILSNIIHFNTGTISSTMLPTVIFKTEEMTLAITIILITFITLIKSSFDSKNKNYIFLGIACISLSCSLLLTFISFSILSALFIIILFTVGTILFLFSMHNITLWG